MDLFHVRRDNHKPQSGPLPGALLALWRHNVRDLEVALPGDAEGLGALTKTGRTTHLNNVVERAPRALGPTQGALRLAGAFGRNSPPNRGWRTPRRPTISHAARGHSAVLTPHSLDGAFIAQPTPHPVSRVRSQSGRARPGAAPHKQKLRPHRSGLRGRTGRIRAAPLVGSVCRFCPSARAARPGQPKSPGRDLGLSEPWSHAMRPTQCRWGVRGSAGTARGSTLPASLQVAEHLGPTLVDRPAAARLTRYAENLPEPLAALKPRVPKATLATIGRGWDLISGGAGQAWGSSQVKGASLNLRATHEHSPPLPVLSDPELVARLAVGLGLAVRLHLPEVLGALPAHEICAPAWRHGLRAFRHRPR